ncbi:hypothetical protein [Spiroplasma eriocheiris]|uniref:Uncharacterized protein n=1 Tax=Spiroplasma eriocheiris TaxID=315358 RepID=A0A0H3XMG4_9MOLU|nr:hypothetical protein [Spiroplasma eriocheiris]AHF57666.1 hypothetical protein SPE_0538 [Spiroplasma eriocheiris CCTCC M 207170]AKM54117.1 hypothetical protein SERIO_v1c05450 [Spiroplasma eriocheiris]
MEQSEIKNGYLYVLKNGQIISIHRGSKSKLLFNNQEDNHNYLAYPIYTEDQLGEFLVKKNECLLLSNVKLEGKLLYLHSTDVNIIPASDIDHPLIVNNTHIRVVDQNFPVQEELTREYNDDLLQRLLDEEEAEFSQKKKPLFKIIRKNNK